LPFFRGEATVHRPTLASSVLLVLASLLQEAAAADYFIANRDTTGLAAAIRHANSTPQPDTLHLAKDGLYALDGEAEAGLALPPILGRLTLRGHGAEIRRNTAQPLALLEVARDGELDIHALTLAEGGRGAVRNHGTLRLHASAVVDGTTQSENAIVQNFGTLEARDTVFGYNQVAGAGRDAAIVLNYGSMHLQRCRVAANSLSRRYPTLAAAPLLNYGELVLDAIALEDNVVIDGFEGLASAAVLNLGVGRTAGTDVPPRP
jgi:hypothetical protein